MVLFDANSNVALSYSIYKIYAIEIKCKYLENECLGGEKLDLRHSTENVRFYTHDFFYRIFRYPATYVYAKVTHAHTAGDRGNICLADLSKNVGGCNKKGEKNDLCRGSQMRHFAEDGCAARRFQVFGTIRSRWIVNSGYKFIDCYNHKLSGKALAKYC